MGRSGALRKRTLSRFIVLFLFCRNIHSTDRRDWVTDKIYTGIMLYTWKESCRDPTMQMDAEQFDFYDWSPKRRMLFHITVFEHHDSVIKQSKSEHSFSISLRNRMVKIISYKRQKEMQRYKMEALKSMRSKITIFMWKSRARKSVGKGYCRKVERRVRDFGRTTAITKLFGCIFPHLREISRIEVFKRK